MTRLHLLLLCCFMQFMPGFAAAQSFGTVNFDFDSAALDASARQEIAEIAERLKAVQSYKPTVVIGYTDASGSNSYNAGLGMRRAQSVAQALVALGVPVDRIGTVESKGENDLLVQVATPERANRRVTVRLEDILAACQSYRNVRLDSSAIGPSLQQDLVTKLQVAMRDYQSFASVGTNGPAYQMAGAAREDCGIAVSYENGGARKVEYAQRCLCSSARLEVAAGRM